MNKICLDRRPVLLVVYPQFSQKRTPRWVPLEVVENFVCILPSDQINQKRIHIESKLTNPTKPRDARASFGCAPTVAPAVMVSHRIMSSAMSISDDIDWPVLSLMLSYHDLRDVRQLPSTLPRSIIFGSVSWRQTWPNLRRLTVDSKSS